MKKMGDFEIQSGSVCQRAKYCGERIVPSYLRLQPKCFYNSVYLPLLKLKKILCSGY